MVRRSMSAGVLLIHNSLAGLVTLLDLSRTTSTDRRPGALYGRTIEQWEGGKAWSSSATTPPVASRFLLPGCRLILPVKAYGELGE